MISAAKEKLASYYQGSSQFIVPFFQRAYVWDEDNWQTLWEHTISVLEKAEEKTSGEHFIGTIITKQRPATAIGQSMYDLIDGQQRLTTFAILLKAIGNASTNQMPNLKNKIDEHLRFQDAKGNNYSRIQLCGYDTPYYDAVITSNGLAHVKNSDHKIIRAYKYFADKLIGFTDDRLDMLRLIILDRVPIISMMLSQDDDEQEIFDTINSLGVRLTTGELLKNHIFQDKDMHGQYESLWKDVYEANEDQIDFWNEEKTAGRIIRTNIEVLLYSYLIIKTGGDIKLESLFKEYKKWLSDKKAKERIAFLGELKEYAEIYSDFPSGTTLGQIGFEEGEKRFFHIVENLVITTVYPLIIYIYKNIADQKVRRDILAVIESYLVRRNICRLTTKNYNLLFIQIINKLEEERRSHGELSAETLARIIEGFNDATNLRPTDEQFRDAIKKEPLSNQNSREILFLIALYQVSTGLADIPKLSLGNYSVEHIMPIKWEANWRSREMTSQERDERNHKLLTLGNLTLVTKRLNSKMQNESWEIKKVILKKNSGLRMTTDYLDRELWNEASIDERGGHLTKSALEIWK